FECRSLQLNVKFPHQEQAVRGDEDLYPAVAEVENGAGDLLDQFWVQVRLWFIPKQVTLIKQGSCRNQQRQHGEFLPALSNQRHLHPALTSDFQVEATISVQFDHSSHGFLKRRK